MNDSVRNPSRRSSSRDRQTETYIETIDYSPRVYTFEEQLELQEKARVDTARRRRGRREQLDFLGRCARVVAILLIILNVLALVVVAVFTLILLASTEQNTEIAEPLTAWDMLLPVITTAGVSAVAWVIIWWLGRRAWNGFKDFVAPIE